MLQQTLKSEKEVDITYRFNFPRKMVFDAWSNPIYLKEWFAPTGCTINFRKLDLREGGSFHSCITTPTGYECWCIGTYIEIKSPERIVFTMINADKDGKPVDPTSIGMDAQWPGETLVTVTFKEENGTTVINLKQTVSETVAKKTGAHPSWIEMLQRLQSLISSL